MGSSIGKLNVFSSLPDSQDCDKTERCPVSQKRKKDCPPDPENEHYAEEQQRPTRKRPRFTSEYVFSTLFLGGKGSDITLVALGSSWHLHRVYLCQSPYFQHLLTEDVVGCNKSEVKMTITDRNIDKEALNVALGSLYDDNVDHDVLRRHVTPIAAAASMLQLDSLLKRCEKVMLKKLSMDHAYSLYRTATDYSMRKLQQKCVSCVEVNLLLQKKPTIFEIPQDLLERVLASPTLFVISVERDLYKFVKVWVYIQLFPECIHSKTKWRDAGDFFLSRDGGKYLGTSVPFLETELGRPFVPVFRCLRLKGLMMGVRTYQRMFDDNIFPAGWILPMFQELWLTQLYAADNGPPKYLSDKMKDNLEQYCLRFGRILSKPVECHWRWNSFLFGIDIVMQYDSLRKIVFVKRNGTVFRHRNMLCKQEEISIALSIRAFTLTKHGTIDRCTETEVTEVADMSRNYLLDTVYLDDSWTFPLYVSGRFYFYPNNERHV